MKGMIHTVEEKFKKENLQKNLKNRRIQMIAIGSAIGAGLFYGSANAINLAGPSISLAYLIGGIFILFIMRALGELAADDPTSGSFSEYATKYFGKFAGFFTGWTYWLQCTLSIMAEITAIGIYIQFWAPNFPTWISALICLIVLLFINLLGVKYYGELEFWFSIIKVIAIICMIIMGLLMIFFGFANSGQPIGISNLWKNRGFFPNGISGFLLSFIFVTFAFGGVELIGITAGEAKNPKESIPKAINNVFWRILLFYVGSMFVMLSIYNWNEIGVNGSPFVFIFDKVGIPYAASIINFVVTTAAFSSMNSNLYVDGRMLYSLSLNNNAPKIFSKISKSGIPYIGILFSTLLLGIVVILNYIVPGKVFTYISSLTTLAILTTWSTILLAQLKSRKEKIKGQKEITFKMPFYPFSSYITLIYLGIICIALTLLPTTRIAFLVAPIWVIFLCILYRCVAKSK
ncbi:putative proline amino acid transporter [Clostridium neonatale]|nr:putative proline amino acid transporter [Clostridium neonatale]